MVLRPLLPNDVRPGRDDFFRVQVLWRIAVSVHMAWWPHEAEAAVAIQPAAVAGDVCAGMIRYVDGFWYV